MGALFLRVIKRCAVRRKVAVGLPCRFLVALYMCAGFLFATESCLVEWRYFEFLLVSVLERAQ